MKKLKIVALVDEPFINTYETLYFESKNCKKLQCFDFVFVCIKSHDERMGDEAAYDTVCNILKSKNIPYIDGWDAKKKKELDIKDLNPDIVLIQTPYDGIKRSELYSSEYISSFAKLIHISYGSTIIDYDQNPFKKFKLIESNKFFDRCWFSAMENPLITKQFDKYHRNKFKSFGYIKLDKYINYKNNPNFPITDRPNFNYIIAWKPRWFASNGDSNFLTYIDYFKRISELRPDVLLLFVLHPLLKDRLIDCKIYTKKEVDNLFNFFAKQKNIKIICDGDFLDEIYHANIFVGDYCSTIVEAAVFDIPTVYTPTKVTLSEFGGKFLRSSYIAHNINDMELILNNLLDGKDYLKTKRKKFINIASPKSRHASYAKDLLYFIKKSC